MNTKQLSFWAAGVLLGLSSFSAQATPFLVDYGFNIDGVVYDSYYDGFGGSPGGVVFDVGFDFNQGLGSITATISGDGFHSFSALFDHEIDEPINTFFNEAGLVSGAPYAGQSWEIDDPYYGDIWDNLYWPLAGDPSALDNTNDSVNPGDVSMAMGWDFNLGLDEIATISLSLTESMPGSGFFLIHNDPNSNENIYFSSTLDISTVAVPEPSMLFLFGIGLAGILANRRRMIKA